jgi:hypothetical protein
MRRRHFTNVLIVLSVLVGHALCQVGKKQPLAADTTPTTRPAAAPDQAQKPKPCPQVERLLRAFEGTWAINEEIAPDSTLPKGATGKGMIVWRPGPGGFSVVEDYKSKQGAREVTGLGVFWGDESAGGYHSIWCDSTNPGGCISFKNVARWEGTQLVLVEDYKTNGKQFTFKEVFGDIAPGTFTQTLFGGEIGGELKVDQTIHARKLAGAAAGVQPRM